MQVREEVEGDGEMSVVFVVSVGGIINFIAKSKGGR